MVSFSISGPFGLEMLRAGLEKDKGEIRNAKETLWVPASYATPSL